MAAADAAVAAESPHIAGPWLLAVRRVPGEDFIIRLREVVPAAR